MAQGRTQAAWTSLDTLLTAGTLGSLPDGELLDHFCRDPATTGQEAFRILVERHGAMVLGVCRSVVKDPHEAEDAFQATFLVLIRRCGSIRRRETIAPWLYGVACRVARRARSRAAARRRREVAAADDLPAPGGPGPEDARTDRTIHEEIGRLPDSLRAPLVLCCLESQSYDVAARRLGLRESTLRGRLHRARRRLEAQLRRRGALTTVAAALPSPDLTPLSSTLVVSTTRLAMRWSGLDGLAVEAGPVASLAQGVLNAMLLPSVKACGFAAVVTLGVVGSLVVAQQVKTGPTTPPAGASQPLGAKSPASGQPRTIDIKTRNEQILAKLDEKVALEFENINDVSFDQLLKAIKKATTTVEFPGIPIYVDPIGLQEAAVNMSSPVSVGRNWRLGHLLREALRPLRLSFIVKDGFLWISSRENINDLRLDDLDRKIDRLLRAVERSGR